MSRFDACGDVASNISTWTHFYPDPTKQQRHGSHCHAFILLLLCQQPKAQFVCCWAGAAFTPPTLEMVMWVMLPRGSMTTVIMPLPGVANTMVR